MGNALEAVLRLKASEEARQKEQSDQITQAVTILQNARQQAQANKIAELEALQSNRKYKADIEQQAFENSFKMKQQSAMENYLKTISGQMGSSNNPNTANIANPTLADAFPLPEQSFIQTPYLSPSGNVGMSNKLDPQYNKQLEIRSSQIKEFEDFASALEKLSTRIEPLDNAIDSTPEFSPGVGSKLIAKGTNALADINNEKWYTDYDQAFNKTFLPAAQAEGMSKVMSDLDLQTQIKSLGDPTVPRSVKKQALQQIRESLGKYAESKINAFGVNKDIVSKIYPEASKTFLSNNNSTSGSKDKPDYDPKTQKLQRNKITGEYRVVPL